MLWLLSKPSSSLRVYFSYFFACFLSIIAQLDLELEQMDIKTSFLHSELEEKIYIKQLEYYIHKVQENKVCLLIKSPYGFKQFFR